MNHIKHFIGRSKFFINSMKYDKYNIKHIIHTNKRSIIFGTSFLGLGFVSYNFFYEMLPFEIMKSYCNSVVNKNRGNVIFQFPYRPIVELDVLDNEKPAEVLVNDAKDIKDESHEAKPIFEKELEPDAISCLPSEVPYLIIGAGVAGMSAARAIRASDPFAKVLIINSECQNPGEHKEVYPPYRRVLLSKFIWRRTEEHKKTLLDTSGDVKSNSFLYIEPDSFFVLPEKLSQLEYGGISLLNNTRVANIDPQESCVTLEGSGHKIVYKACLIATGSFPRRLKHLELSDNTGKDLYNDGKVSYFRSLNDFRNLSDIIKQLREKENGGRLMIVGSGLLGTELTSSLGRLAKEQGNLEVIEVFKEKSHLFHLLPEELSLFIQKNIAKNTVKLISQSEVVSIGEVTDGPELGRLNVGIKSLSNIDDQTLSNERVDHVVIAAGVKPDTALSDNGNLELDQMLGGFLVNAELQAREGIFVAGDACSFYDPLLGRRRVEHWDHSEESGGIAGHNMASYVLKTLDEGALARIDRSKVARNILKPKIYDFQSSFSFKLSMYRTVEALGLIDSSLETSTFVAQDFFDAVDDDDAAAVTQTSLEPAAKRHDPLDMPGVVFYLRGRRVVGILLWNCDDDIVIDSDFPSPLRSNVARKILAERRLIASDDELKQLAADFDLSFFVNSQIKFLDEYTKKKQQQADLEMEKS